MIEYTSFPVHYTSKAALHSWNLFTLWLRKWRTCACFACSNFLNFVIKVSMSVTMYGVLALLAISTLDMLTFSANLSIATFKMQKDCMDRQSLTSKKSELMSKSYTTVF